MRCSTGPSCRTYIGSVYESLTQGVRAELDNRDLDGDQLSRDGDFSAIAGMFPRISSSEVGASVKLNRRPRVKIRFKFHGFSLDMRFSKAYVRVICTTCAEPGPPAEGGGQDGLGTERSGRGPGPATDGDDRRRRTTRRNDFDVGRRKSELGGEQW